jgi:hypothetical protein
MRDPYIAFSIFVVIFILSMYLLFRNRDEEEPNNDKGEIEDVKESIDSRVHDLFNQRWIFHMDADKCRDKWDLEVPPTTIITFEQPSHNTVVMKLESKESKGSNRVKYSITPQGVLFSTPQGEPLYLIRDSKYIRLLQVEKTVTNGEKCEWELKVKEKNE